MPGTPNIHGRGTRQSDVDKFNEQMRANPEYQALIATMKHDSKGQVSLSDKDRARVAEWLASKGVNVNNGLKIDQAGNINQKNRLGKIAITAALVGGTIATAGALGAFSAPALAGSAAVPSIGATSGLAAGAFPAIAGTTGAGLATGAGVAGAAGLGAATVPSIGATSGLSAGAFPSIAGTAGPSVAGAGRTGGSVLSKLVNKDTIGDLSEGLGAVSSTQAHNRGTQLDAMMEADKMNMAQNVNRRADEADIWKKLSAINYIKGGSPEIKPQISASGRVIPHFDTGLKPISQADKDVATTLEKQLLERLNNVPKLRDYDSKMSAGKVETGLGWLAPILRTAGNVYGK